MQFMLIAAALVAGSPQPVNALASNHEAASVLAEHVQTGTLILSQGDCLAVRVFTASPYTHVAAVVVEQGHPVVYDCANGVGVRKQLLEEYLDSQSPDAIHVFHPCTPFSAEQAQAFETSLNKQLGRAYGIKHHLTGRRAEGLHCAEYVTDALMSPGLIHANSPPRVSPASLVEGILKADLYSLPHTFELNEPVVVIDKDAPWCSRMWAGTKLCTINCCSKMSGWFLCR